MTGLLVCACQLDENFPQFHHLINHLKFFLLANYFESLLRTEYAGLSHYLSPFHTVSSNRNHHKPLSSLPLLKSQQIASILHERKGYGKVNAKVNLLIYLKKSPAVLLLSQSGNHLSPLSAQEKGSGKGRMKNRKSNFEAIVA